MRWISDAAYCLLLAAVSPIIVWRMLRHGRYRRGLPEKLFGLVSICRDERPSVWFHAVSVGEVIQLQKIVQEFRRQTSDQYRIIVSTSTDTGWDLARQRFAECEVTWFPLDFSWAVRRALQRIQPSLVVLMELELWPGFLAECQRRRTPVSVINARMSERSHRGYLRFRPFLNAMFRSLTLVASQSREYSARLHSLGVPEERLRITGSIKFDGVETNRQNPGTQILKSLFQIGDDETVFVAGSTQHPEETLAINAWKNLRHEWPGLRLILVPRHKERFEEVAALLRAEQIPLCRRSEMTSLSQVSAETAGSAVSKDGPPPVMLLDTIGELSACWGLADIAFVGGSFGNRGGQNMIEPAAYGASVLFGPNTWNFRDVVELFRNAQACVQLDDPAQLEPAVRSLLENSAERHRLGCAAHDLVVRQQGATKATTSLLRTVLKAAGENPTAQFRKAA